MTRPARGFTLIEVLVALAIVALALATGLKASGALAVNANRQTDTLLAQWCAGNVLVEIQLARTLPEPGRHSRECDQAGQRCAVGVTVSPTPNPNFRRVDVQVSQAQGEVLRLSTIAGRY